MKDDYQQLGNCSVRIDKLKINCKGFVTAAAQDFNTIDGTPSGPAVDEDFNIAIEVRTSSSVKNTVLRSKTSTGT